MKNRFLVITLAVLTLGLFVGSNVLAGEDPDPDVPPEPSQQQTSVGRLSVIRGQVSTAHGDAGEWAAGTVNTPVLVGDRISTGDHSRAEIQLDPNNVMRLDEKTEVRVADLEPTKMQLQLASGLVDFSVLNGTQADVEIDTPNMGVHPLSPGLYRIQVNSDTDTSLIVRRGEAEVLTNQGSTKVEAGQIIQIRGADNPEYRTDQAPGRDEFDQWSMDRDRQIANSQPPQYSQAQPSAPPQPQITGSSDLNTYGQWGEVPDYGWCWTPEVDAGWVPYSAGTWGYEPYWGWTWISYEPWGWAPYHYGRWFMYGGAWRWWPGQGAFFGPRPLWAPAYVSFFGWGHGFGVGLGFGSVGWLALGPRDIFHPWYGAGHHFETFGFDDFHRAGFIRAGGPEWGSNLARAGSDARIRGAIRNVSAQGFASGHMGRSMPVSEGMLHSATMFRGGLPVSHTQVSYHGSAGFSASHFGGAGSQHFFSSNGAAWGGHSSGFSSSGLGRGMTQRSPVTGHMETGQSGFHGSNNWQAYSHGGQSGFQGRSAPSFGSEQHNWQRYASPNPYAGGRSGYNSGSRSYYGGGNAGRSGGSYYGGRSEGSYYDNRASRPPLNLNQPVMRQRAPSGGYGGGRNYSAPRSNGGGHNYSGGGGRSYGGGGGHSSGGGHGGGGRR